MIPPKLRCKQKSKKYKYKYKSSRKNPSIKQANQQSQTKEKYLHPTNNREGKLTANSEERLSMPRGAGYRKADRAVA